MLGTQMHESLGRFFFAKSDPQIWGRKPNMKIFSMGKSLSLIRFPLLTHLSLTAFQHRLTDRTPALHGQVSLQNTVDSTLTQVTDSWEEDLDCNTTQLWQVTVIPACWASKPAASTHVQAPSRGLREPWFVLALLRHVPQGQHVQPRPLKNTGL